MIRPPPRASTAKCAVTPFGATGLTNFLANRGTLENAHAMADHASPRMTQLADTAGDEITLDEVERIGIGYFTNPNQLAAVEREATEFVLLGVERKPEDASCRDRSDAINGERRPRWRERSSSPAHRQE